VAAEQVVEGRPGAAVVRDVDLDAGFGFEQLGCEIERRAGAAARAEGELAGVLFGEIDEVLQRFHAELVLHHHDQRAGGDLGDRCELGQVERIVRMQRLGDQGRGRNEEQRVAVGGRRG
jgi:hypothetical protein